MTTNNDFNSRLSQLQIFEKSQDYSNIITTLNQYFDSDANNIIKKWTSNKDTLSNDEKKYIDLYSNIQLSFVKYCFFNSNTIADVEILIDKFRVRLFQKTQIDTLADAVTFIREQQSNSNENDLILIYIMRMIDARSLAYRLYFKNLSPPPANLNDELKDCLLHHHAKDYLYDVKSTNEINENMSITYRHKFFIGCCTFAIALYENNKDMLTDDKRNNKYICLLAKYIRIMLNKTNVEQNESILYCIRGILALLTNCVPIEHWLTIMNVALADENNEDAQKKNPFNLDLFSSIVNNLLASKTLQKKTERSGSNDETLLLDTALVFLVKWSDTQTDFNDDDGDKNNNNYSSPFDEPNQLLHCFCSHEQFQGMAQIIIPYIDAKYDRLRLMALSILSTIMNNQDFEKLKNRKPHMDEDLVKLIFDFINQAVKQSNKKYKGISFDTLLRYLHRFLVQDFIKQATLPYISQIVDYAKNHSLYALKILRKISTSSKIKNDLLANAKLEQFLKNDADILYEVNERMYKIIKDIRQNLAPPPKRTEPLPSDNYNTCQAFISYCHHDDEIRKLIEEKLKEVKLFTKIWVDKRYMKDDMIDTISKAISQSKVVFVLLSDAYCHSDYCRREWTYAINEKIKIYVIFVQKDFDKRKYDWVRFIIENNTYYKIHKNDDLQKLIENLSEILNKKLENEPRPTSPTPSIPVVSASNQEYLTKTITTWTSEDVKNWCTDNRLEKWCKPLANYDGQNLVGFRRDLSNDIYIERFNMAHTLDLFDVSRFKSEVDKILLRTMTKHVPPTTTTTTTHKLPTKKHVIKRRISKITDK